MDSKSEDTPPPRWPVKSKSGRNLAANVIAASQNPTPPLASSDNDEPFDSAKYRIRREPKPPNFPIRCQVKQRSGNSTFRVSVCSMQGHREDMEDAHAIILGMKNHKNCGFFGVYDGHSGAKAAEWCAKHVHDFIDEVDEFTDEALEKALVKADLQFLQETKATPPIQDGTTAVYCIVNTETREIHVSNLGDSRCLLGSYSSKTWKAMTTDHKPHDEAEVERVNAAGGQVARNRVDGVLSVSRSIGDATYKDNPNLPHEKQKVIAVPVITKTTLTEDNFIFLCCDGIFETFTSEEAIFFIHDALQQNPKADPCDILSDLLYAVLGKGSKDNMTAILVELKDGTSYNQPNEFVVGEYFERGNATFIKGYKDYCEKNGKDFEEAKAEWEKKKPKEEKPPEKQLSLEDLVAKLCTIDCLAASALRDAFITAEQHGKLVKNTKKPPK